MYRFKYYGDPQDYALSTAPHYYRNRDAQRKETLVLPNYVMYEAAVEPKFTELLFQHIGLKIVITTTVGKLVGTLDDVSIDHVTLDILGKDHHIRLCEIVYFEIAKE
jgi:hypothetical protein